MPFELKKLGMISEENAKRFCGCWSFSKQVIWELQNGCANQTDVYIGGVRRLIIAYVEQLSLFVRECEEKLPGFEALSFWHDALNFWSAVANLNPGNGETMKPPKCGQCNSTAFEAVDAVECTAQIENGAVEFWPLRVDRTFECECSNCGHRQDVDPAVLKPARRGC